MTMYGSPLEATLRHILVLVLLFAAPARGADIAVGTIRGGSVTTFAWDVSSAGVLYAGVHGGGLYKSSDSGANWTQIFLPTVASHFALDVLASRLVAGTVFVCEGVPSDAAIWRSTDSAGTFTNVLGSGPGVGTCYAMAEGTTGGTFYAGLFDGGNTTVYRSIDAGATFAPLAGTIPGAAATKLLALPSGRIVAGTRNGGNGTNGSLVYSDDDGATWVTGLAAGGVFGMARSDSGTIMALLATGAVVTSTDGAAWTTTTTVIGTDLLSQPVVYHAGSDTFFLLTGDDRLYRSADVVGGYSLAGATDLAAGLTLPVPLSLNRHTAVAVSPASTARILIGNGEGEGVFATDDGGGTWAISNDGLYSPHILFALKSVAAGYRYAANLSGGVYFAGTSLDSWKQIFRGTDITRDVAQGLAFDQVDPKRVIVSLTNLNGQARLLVLDDAVAAAEDGPPFAHAGWRTLTYPGPVTRSPVFAMLVEGPTYFAGTCPRQNPAAGQYLYRSDDSGASWMPTSLVTTGGIKSLAFDPSDHQVIYAGSGDFDGVGYHNSKPSPHSDGIYRSSDGGGTWMRLAGSGLDVESPRTILVDPANPMRIWVLADPQTGGIGNEPDIWESVDAGATWTNITPGPPVGSRFALTYSPSEGLLVLASGGNGINVYAQVPGSGSTAWQPAFGVYGEASVLYPGSVGLGTGTGLYEATNIQLGGGQDGGSDGGGGLDGGGGDLDGGGGGCGCRVGGREGGAPISLPIAAIALAGLRRRRRGIAAPGASFAVLALALAGASSGCGGGSDFQSVAVSGTARLLNGATPTTTAAGPIPGGGGGPRGGGPAPVDGDWVISPNQVRARLVGMRLFTDDGQLKQVDLGESCFATYDRGAATLCSLADCAFTIDVGTYVHVGVDYDATFQVLIDDPSMGSSPTLLRRRCCPRPRRQPARSSWTTTSRSRRAQRRTVRRRSSRRPSSSQAIR